MARLALVSTPRSGNTWLRRLISDAYGLAEVLAHTPDEVYWDDLYDAMVLQLHWLPTVQFRQQLTEHQFRIVTIARHPFDVLISILHFAIHEPTTAYWLAGQGGDEQAIRGADPQDPAFLSYACGERAKALLSVTPSWWPMDDVAHIRYEDLVIGVAYRLEQLGRSLGLNSVRDLKDVIEANTLSRLRLANTNHHFWRGLPGHWRLFLTAADVTVLLKAHAQTIVTLGYENDCAPDPWLNPERARQNWAMAAAR